MLTLCRNGAVRWRHPDPITRQPHILDKIKVPYEWESGFSDPRTPLGFALGQIIDLTPANPDQRTWPSTVPMPWGMWHLRHTVEVGCYTNRHAVPLVSQAPVVARMGTARPRLFSALLGALNFLFDDSLIDDSKHVYPQTGNARCSRVTAWYTDPQAIEAEARVALLRMTWDPDASNGEECSFSYLSIWPENVPSQAQPTIIDMISTAAAAS